MLSEIITFTAAESTNKSYFSTCCRAPLRMAAEGRRREGGCVEYIHKCMVSCSPAGVLDISHEENRFAQRRVAKPLNVSTNYIYTLVT